MKGLFINSQKSICSIYESGQMCYQILANNTNFQLDYTEAQNIDLHYDFYIFNYHHATNCWITKSFIDQYLHGKTFCIVTEVSNAIDPMPLTPKIFDYYILLDPTWKDTNNIFGFPRPLEISELNEYIGQDFPTIGSFGFATDGKRWDLVIDAVQKEYDHALIKINIPPATYVPNNINRVNEVIKQCNSMMKKPGIKLEITQNYMTKQELIIWCSQNTLNCFFYYRNEVGLSAVTDQAISAKRPLLVNDGPTFRHILQYLQPFPKIGIRDTITSTQHLINKMYHDWSPQVFNDKFNYLLKRIR